LDPVSKKGQKKVGFGVLVDTKGKMGKLCFTEGGGARGGRVWGPIRNVGCWDLRRQGRNPSWWNRRGDLSPQKGGEEKRRKRSEQREGTMKEGKSRKGGEGDLGTYQPKGNA